ncbi:YiiX/YebB-like N1pC/P60 family cysteine hydrolase [Alteribacillus sp. HJP-4]|uniref:YiiX/YebB-like N1pC/P60 family cysteine hydrolase n=1 Tax=Alteribacillus sp. HJP-4 TaxID=2775394 RepID=UPI0035CD29BA
MVSSIFLLCLVLIFQSNHVSAASYPSTTATVEPGDILVTKTTNCKDEDECKGITGHAGIVIDNTYAVHISGPGANPERISISEWFEEYHSTKVVRADSKYRGDPSKAATWAEEYVKDFSHADYSVTANIASKDPTYCSKLVYQAYYSTGYPIVATSGIIHPYEFLKKGDIVTSENW